MIHAERGNRQLVGVSLEGRRFEQFIQELSASFVRSPVDEIASEIDHWIREIVLGLNLDRGALAQIDAKSGKLTVRHSWGRDRLVKLPIGLELARPAPWFDGTLMKGRTVVFSSVNGLPRSDDTFPNRMSRRRSESEGKSLEHLGLRL